MTASIRRGGLLIKTAPIVTVAFDGTANLGAVGALPIWTLTGRILVVSIATFCTEDLAGATATLELGVASDTDLFIASTTATDIDNNDWWVDATPTEVGGVLLPAALKDVLVSESIRGTVGTAAISDGTLEFYCQYVPLTVGANLVSAQ